MSLPKEMFHLVEEVFYLVEVRGADRRYIWHTLSPEYRAKLEAQGARIFRVTVPIVDGTETLEGTSELLR